MRIEFSTEGGIAHFPGLAKPSVIEAEDLSSHEAEQLRDLLAAAPASPPQPAPAASTGADRHTYVIHVVEAARAYTIRVSDPIQDRALADLVSFLRSKSKELRAKNAPRR